MTDFSQFEWHDHFLWWPTRIRGKTLWLRTVQRKRQRSLEPLNGAPSTLYWMYRP